MNLAAEISSKYRNLQCEACVKALASKLPGQVLKIDIRPFVRSSRAYIVHRKFYPNEAISITGLHYGFLFDGRVYDNLHHQGVLEEEWLSGFLFCNPGVAAEASIAIKHVSRLTPEQFLRES